MNSRAPPSAGTRRGAEDPPKVATVLGHAAPVSGVTCEVALVGPQGRTSGGRGSTASPCFGNAGEHPECCWRKGGWLHTGVVPVDTWELVPGLLPDAERRPPGRSAGTRGPSGRDRAGRSGLKPGARRQHRRGASLGAAFLCPSALRCHVDMTCANLCRGAHDPGSWPWKMPSSAQKQLWDSGHLKPQQREITL